jgi:hypothetical protein
MNYCENCGVAETFAELKRIPPTFILSHLMDNHSSPPRLLCVDERGCVRRFGMRMKPLPYHQRREIGHVLIECCGEEYKLGGDTHRVLNGIEEEWEFNNDPLPEHRYVCSRCGKVQIATKWKEYHGLDRR